ncbi:hypothetical protein Pcinc_009163 [Petrolisthes cinctipes]|uniref:Reverse transcriptase domain-containing protein n=1 Tax=Petrolisthes cinctipes TaxID=88211 RepID=A0AAE1G7Y2_PETCI|nr:hypothetical protein Pcinc_009163 [Petrolisthes cinctipes]
MVSVAQVRTVLRKGDWLASLDLKDAYWHVPIHPRFRRFLAFQVGTETFQFTRLPFGLSLAPRVFTKLVRVVASRLAEAGVPTLMYLDDWLLHAPSKEQVANNVRVARGVLEEMGFLLNIPKSSLTPTRKLCWLGIEWDSLSATLSLAPDNARRTLRHVRRAHFSRTFSRRQWESLLGSLNFAACNAPGTTETQEADAGGKPPPVPRTQGPSQASVPLSPPPPSPLATSRCPASAGPLGVPSPGDYGGDRRIGRRLGIPVLPGTSTVRGMEGRGKATAHQRPGVDGSEGMAQQTPSVCQDRRPLRYGQRCGRSVPTETGHRTVGNSPVPVRTDFRNSGQEGHSPLGPLRARAGERLGGRPIQVQGDVSRVATASPCVRVSLPSLRDTGGGPIRLPIHGPTPSVPDFLIQNRGGRPGRLHGGLEQVGSSLPLPTPSHFSPPEGDPQAAHFQGEGSPHSPPLASTAMVRRVVPVVPASPSVGIGMPLQHPVCTTPSVTETTRLEFLRGVLSKRFTKETVDKMLRAHRQSSVRQYESCRKRFQDFLRRHPSRVISEDTVLEFLTWLADSTNRAPATVLAHHAALSDPLLLGFNIKVSERPLSLLRMGIRAGTAPHRAQAPSWSLHRVLSYLTFEGVPLEVCHLLQKALFLLALATGYRASQLAALTRHTAFSSVTPNLTSLTISPSPAFLAKNEQADDRIGPLAVPSFLRDGNFHPLCPVHAFVAYVEATRGASPDHLFYNSRSGNPLFPRSIARLLCRVIENGDPGHAPRAHSVRGVAASLAFLRTHSVERVRDLGGWASTSSFRKRYLFHSLSPTPCVAMGTPPPIPQGPRGRHMGGRGRPKRKVQLLLSHPPPDAAGTHFFLIGVDERYSAEEGLNTSPHHHQVAPLSVQRQI